MFEEVKFRGVFRSYQQKILEDADGYLADGRIHIVAAPGSGKTVLGLELMRRLGMRALVLSPTTTIRNQWGERFCGMFAGGEVRISYDLRDPADITSVTYQALYAAMQRRQDEEDGTDYASFDVVAKMKENGIGTICLDEAHHLQNEWQKALESFLASMEGIKTIALTATPPYDASPSEWKRYTDLCGEIDEEIFVPELVKEGSLCPHQDYIYINFPTERETEQFHAYKLRAAEGMKAFYASPYIGAGYARLLEKKQDYEFLYAHAGEAMSFLVLYEAAGFRADKKLCKSLALRRPFAVTLERLEKGLDFLLNVLLEEEDRAQCLRIFSERSLVERGKVSLALNERLRKRLLASVGKLKGIEEIIRRENACMAEKLRLLVLTDYIKKESVSIIGTDKEPDSVNVVSVYETARRTGVPAGALSGSLVILPRGCAARLKEYGAAFRMTDTADENVCIYTFEGNNLTKVGYVSRLFEEGKIRVLVGTKSLLGEGWDAPCVNTLILASFVGSFMLSNQMRGRAIRTYAGEPGKTANIWHLVTVERPWLTAEKWSDRIDLKSIEEPDLLQSYDFRTVARRFDCFVGPDYESGTIRNGIGRISVLRPPFNEKGIERIDAEMFAAASRRAELASVWHRALDGTSARINEASEIPQQNTARAPYLFVNALMFAFFAVMMSLAVYGAVNCFMTVARHLAGEEFPVLLGGILLCVAALYLAVVGIRLFLLRIMIWCSPRKSIRKLCQCVMETMQELDLLSKNVSLGVTSTGAGLVIQIELLNASVHDQNLFHAAVEDMFTPIRNPRYILAPGCFGKYFCWRAMACPEILSSKKEYAEKLAEKLKTLTGKLQVVYTRTERGRRLILKCRKSSFVSKNYAALHRSKQLSRWE